MLVAAAGMLVEARRDWFAAANPFPHPQRTLSPYFNDTRWRETTMPSIFWREVIGAAWVSGIMEGRGA